LYLANWGTHVLKLRLPSRLLGMEAVRLFCPGESAFAREKNDKVILTFVSEDEEGGEWVEGENWLPSLISVRAELARGDLRCLYLAWLLCAQSGELDNEDIEPPIPPGLARLSASLESLAEFLRIDADLLHVVAQASQPMDQASPKREEILAWVTKLPSGEKDDLLVRLVTGEDAALPATMLQRFIKECHMPSPRSAEQAKRRTVGELLRAGKEHAEERRRSAAKKAADEKARREREAAIARVKYLDGIAGRESKLWAEIESLIATKQPTSYDLAVEGLADLRDLAARKGKTEEYCTRLEALRAAHARKPTLIERMRKAGLGA
jgi:hypothetical protein